MDKYDPNEFFSAERGGEKPDYIERDALLKAFPVDNYYTQTIRAFPAADVRPVVRGRWMGEADGYADGHLVYDIWRCGCCGMSFDEWDEKPDWSFCPNRGADMREVQ